MLHGENIGLLTHRPQSPIDDFTFAFCTQYLIDQCTAANKSVGGGSSYLFPLYLYPSVGSQTSLLDVSTTDRTENLSVTFRHWVDQLYQHRYNPEEILGYIYAVLYSPTYRTDYFEFLKLDFPRIPFVKDRSVFEQLSCLGWELIQEHLINKNSKGNLGTYIGVGSDIIEKITYDPNEQKIYINSTQFFSNVPKEVWDFCIGGYNVIERNLKKRKKNTLSLEEIENIEKITNILAFTIQQMNKIDEIYKKVDKDNFH